MDVIKVIMKQSIQYDPKLKLLLWNYGAQSKKALTIAFFLKNHY